MWSGTADISATMRVDQVAAECHDGRGGSRIWCLWCGIVEAGAVMLYLCFTETSAGEREAGMNVKVSIELPERYLQYAEGLVRDGAYGSLSELVEEHLRDLMQSNHQEPTQEQIDAVTAMADEIRRRMASPPDQWLEMDENDTMFDDLLRYADEQIKAGR